MHYFTNVHNKAMLWGLLAFFLGYTSLANAQTIQESVKLYPAIQEQGDLFGFSVAAYENRIFVGALKQDHHTNGEDTGAAFLYRLDDGVWQPEVFPLPKDLQPNDGFGGKVAMHESMAAVNAIGYDGISEDGGIVFLYQRIDSTWQEATRISAPDSKPGDAFGQSIAMSHDSLVIGAPKTDDKGEDAGSVYVYAKDDADWTFMQKLNAPDGAAGDVFGISVSMSGDTILIGADLNDEKANNAGAAYVYIKRDKQWLLQSKLMASDGGDTDIFGVRVALDGDTALISARRDDDEKVGKDAGSAYVFRRKGDKWYQETKLTGPTQKADDRFGRSVALLGDTALIGAMHKDYTGKKAGAAYLYKRQSSTWKLVKTFTASDGKAGDQLGWSLALTENHGIVSAAKHASISENAGAVYVFKLKAD